MFIKHRYIVNRLFVHMNADFSLKQGNLCFRYKALSQRITDHIAYTGYRTIAHALMFTTCWRFYNLWTLVARGTRVMQSQPPQSLSKQSVQVFGRKVT